MAGRRSALVAAVVACWCLGPRRGAVRADLLFTDTLRYPSCYFDLLAAVLLFVCCPYNVFGHFDIATFAAFTCFPDVSAFDLYLGSARFASYSDSVFPTDVRFRLRYHTLCACGYLHLCAYPNAKFIALGYHNTHWYFDFLALDATRSVLGGLCRCVGPAAGQASTYDCYGCLVVDLCFPCCAPGAPQHPR